MVSRFQEVSNILYTQNTFEFDHPLSLAIFKKTVHPSSLNSIRSISVNLQRDLYQPVSPSQAFQSLRLDVWPDMWVIIAGMEGLEEIRVRFRFLLEGWLGWSEEEVLEPLWNVTRPMRVFEVDTLTTTSFRGEETPFGAPFKLLRTGPERKVRRSIFGTLRSRFPSNGGGSHPWLSFSEEEAGSPLVVRSTPYRPSGSLAALGT